MAMMRRRGAIPVTLDSVAGMPPGVGIVTRPVTSVSTGGTPLRPASCADHGSASAASGDDVGTVNTRAPSTARPLRSDAVDTRICEPERFTSRPRSVTKNASDLVSAPFEPRST